jgi:hypothetical protein
MTTESRPGLGIVAFALGISALIVALTCGILGLAPNLDGTSPDWLNIALGAALMDAMLGLEIGRRAGKLNPPHSTLRKVGSVLALAAILAVLAIAAKLAAN